MANKINEGDVMEGIFAIACSLFIAYGKIDKMALNKLRTQIEPNKFRSGRVVVDVAEGVEYAEDRISVQLQIRLKPGSVVGAFGDDFAMYVEKSSDIGELNSKIETLIKYAKSAAYLKRLNQLKAQYSNNNKLEKLKFVVVADGVEGEQSGGSIKGDVMISLYVEDSNGTKLLSRPNAVSYSVKSGSKTAANLSPYNGMLAIAKHFSVQYASPERYENVMNRICRTQAEKDAMNDAIREMFLELTTLLVDRGDSITKDAIEYIRYNVQGSDQAFLVDIGPTKLKEIPSERFEVIEKGEMKIKAIRSGDYIKFVSTSDPKLILFSLRLKIRQSASTGSYERKFLVETGNMLY